MALVVFSGHPLPQPAVSSPAGRPWSRTGVPGAAGRRRHGAAVATAGHSRLRLTFILFRRCKISQSIHAMSIPAL